MQKVISNSSMKLRAGSTKNVRRQTIQNESILSKEDKLTVDPVEIAGR